MPGTSSDLTTTEFAFSTLQILDIGEAKDEFKYNVEDEETFAEARAEYFQDVMHQSSSLICESPTPSKEDIQVGKWRLLGAVD